MVAEAIVSISKAKKTGKIKTGILRKLSIGFDRLSLSIEKERDCMWERERCDLSKAPREARCLSVAMLGRANAHVLQLEESWSLVPYTQTCASGRRPPPHISKLP